MQLELTSTFFFMFVLTTRSSEKCCLQISARMKNMSVTLRNIDIKLCQTECTRSSFIFTSCRKWSGASKKIGESSIRPKDRTHTPVRKCPSNDCNRTSLCLECGKDCVQPMLTPLLRDPQAEDKLHQACKSGNLSAVRLILCQRRVDINCKQSGWTPIMQAVQEGHLEVIKLLVSKGANVSLTSTLGDNILHLACTNGPLEVVQYVLSLDVVDINSRGWNKRTPVMLAGFTGRLIIVDVLVNKGGDVALVDEDSNNILHLACKSGQGNVALYVLSLGVIDINSRGWKRKTPLMMAAEEGHSELAEILVRKDANASLVDIGGDNILHMASAVGNDEMVRYVLSYALIDINSRGHNGKTPLMLAAEKGHRALVELLVHKGAHALFVDTDGNNVLHLACENKCVEVAQYILSQHLVNIDVKNSRGQTAVMIAHDKKLTGLFDHL